VGTTVIDRRKSVAEVEDRYIAVADAERPPFSQRNVLASDRAYPLFLVSH
jgi:hypothetical protein